MNAPIISSTSSSGAPSSQQSPAHNQPFNPPAPAQVKAPSTAPFLKDFNLVAEAAKRAQVAVMVRDFADCGI
ncbi:Fc.00g099060.m01.CDS01 [Cosmosporella sp. VM-42]